MALPPAWLAVYEALVHCGGPEGEGTKVMAHDVADRLTVQGWRVVPGYAVDDSRMPVGLRLPDDLSHLLEPGKYAVDDGRGC